MNRKQFVCRTLQLGLGSCTLGALQAVAERPAEAAQHPPDDLAAARAEREFVRNWVSDLVDAIDEQLPREARVRLIEACGRGCYRRHEFKRAIAEQGKGDLDKLIAAYRKNFEIWRDGERVHVRYCEVSGQCYCPVVKARPAKADDLHCECTRATHQSIFEAALGRPVEVEILESLRRGGKTCHFVAHVA